MRTTPTSTVSERNAAMPERDAASYIAMSPAYLRKARQRGYGPAFIRVKRTIRYRISDLDRWLSAHAVAPEERRARAASA